MINIHLVTYFNVASSGVVVGSDLLLKTATVAIYHREDAGVYQKEKEETNLHDYIRSKGFELIKVTHVVMDVLQTLQSKAQEEPERYGTLLKQAERDYQQLKRDAEFFPHKQGVYEYGIDAYPLILKNLTGGYWGAHCMTAALQRG